MPLKMRMINFQEFSKGFGSFTPRASFRRKFGSYNTFIVNRPLTDTKSLAVSDGDLNSPEVDGRRGSSRSLNSNASRPSVKSGGHRGFEGSVASWAVSFERLLEDPTGVRYFTEFLKSEVSAENILFWQACEKFRQIPADRKDELAREARKIYDTYLSISAFNAINIDDTARMEESELRDPKTDMFAKPQQQIFKLMKFDSYTRFVKSQLYQSCMLANVEGGSLPDLCPGSRSPGSIKSPANHSPALSDSSKKKKKLKVGVSLPFDSEDYASRKRATLDSRLGPEKSSKRDKRREKRGSWGEFSDHSQAMVGRRESQSSVHSAASLELGQLGSLTNKSENGRSSPRCQDAEKEGRTVKYCCVYLPDGTASLAPVRFGLTVRDMLSGICEKRGIPLSGVKIYLQDKDKPLSLDQDSSVLMDKQVMLETRITFALEMVPLNKTIGIAAKSSKSLLEALEPILGKNGLKLQDMEATISGETHPLKMNMPVTSLANKKVVLDRVKGRDNTNLSCAPVIQVNVSSAAAAVDVKKAEMTLLARNQIRGNTKARNAMQRRTYEVDGLIDLLSKVQSCRVDDQRGLLNKEYLVVPQFLQLPVKEEEPDEDEGTTAEETLISPGPASSMVTGEGCRQHTEANAETISASSQSKEAPSKELHTNELLNHSAGADTDSDCQPSQKQPSSKTADSNGSSTLARCAKTESGTESVL
ncbi:regulator of G-protein signaling 14-like isoform X1 [Acipenser oxyrinchus oxyrinchus]|uniref:Regulator of G-protein signaling 14-like isoform X1 n=1 Tax=Acipenser oxyrinchus oxyrinchus TaxID=40147 RepID=A0AAD8CZS5_ACIOX|nr:regulator of G-protein signaling 14-like isoform X1 [Acipenser oxyrinchus oxyrinchus]